MSDFGDWEEDDSFGLESADPEQVARKLHEYEGGRWDELTAEQRAGRIELFVRLIAWGRRQGVFR